MLFLPPARRVECLNCRLNNYNVSKVQQSDIEFQVMRQQPRANHLSVLLPLGIVFFVISSLVSPVSASAEPVATSEKTNTVELSMKGFVPDKTDWSEKASAKYEKTKDGGGVPMAMLSIERLNLKAPVYPGTRKITLDRGLGWIEGTANPDEVGNIAISGHRDGFFRPLKDIEVGDVIEMLTVEKTQKFEVVDIRIVDVFEVSVLDPADTTILTLITCYPFYFQGYAPDRYIVRATPIDGGSEGTFFSTHGATNQAPTGIQ